MSGPLVICDDDDKRLNRFQEGFEEMDFVLKNFDVETLGTEEIKETIGELEDRRTKLRSGEDWEANSLIDKTSIFFIDHELRRVSAADLAYLARCFSGCGLIIGFNVYGRYADVNFNLNLGRETLDIDSNLNYDVIVDDKQFWNEGLWKGEGEKEFRPWYWPKIIEYQHDLEKKIDDIARNVGEPILEHIGFPWEIAKVIPSGVSEFLGETPLKSTFREFVLKSENALKPKDRKKIKELSEKQIARISAARISNWLERLVLPAQNILIDAPHLVYRYPSLLKGEISEREDWNKTSKLTKNAKELGINLEKTNAHKFNRPLWLSRLTWFWKDVSNDRDILEVDKPYEREEIDYVFCEDTSKFHSIKESYHKFDVAFETPNRRRYVKRLEDVHYFPIGRLSD